MYRHEVIARISNDKAIAIIRETTRDDARAAANALLEARMPAVEVTCTTPGAFDIVESLSGGSCLVGLGTVLSASEAADAAHAGAAFIVTPNLDEYVIRAAHRHGLATLVGCSTPTEIVQALEAGADAIKIFPAEQMGMGFPKAVHGPLPWAPLIPVGGVSVTNARQWLDTGCIAVALGSGLTKGSAHQITQRVHDLLTAVGSITR